MKSDLIHSLTDNFEAHAQQTETGVEYWLARDIQHLLGYAKWENFQLVIGKAKTACEVSGHEVADHFPDVRKMVEIGSGTRREIDDILLTRYACYLVAQNGDPRKEEIAFAQTYFAVQTRRAELIEQRLLEAERVLARQKLTTSEKELSAVIFEQTGGNDNFALIRSNGNYLCIQHFLSALNKKGRAGFVMANSAADARASEQETREKIIRAGHVDVMVAIGPNFFFTVILPCTLWFFDKGKVGTDRADKELFLDARHIFRQLGEGQLLSKNSNSTSHSSASCAIRIYGPDTTASNYLIKHTNSLCQQN